jgi:hypothetical protein
MSHDLHRILSDQIHLHWSCKRTDSIRKLKAASQAKDKEFVSEMN